MMNYCANDRIAWTSTDLFRSSARQRPGWLTRRLGEVRFVFAPAPPTTAQMRAHGERIALNAAWRADARGSAIDWWLARLSAAEARAALPA
jgi:hypothetical protein